jgi:hypothetical protein
MRSVRTTVNQQQYELIENLKRKYAPEASDGEILRLAFRRYVDVFMKPRGGSAAKG